MLTAPTSETSRNLSSGGTEISIARHQSPIANVNTPQSSDDDDCVIDQSQNSPNESPIAKAKSPHSRDDDEAIIDQIQNAPSQSPIAKAKTSPSSDYDEAIIDLVPPLLPSNAVVVSTTAALQASQNSAQLRREYSILGHSAGTFAGSITGHQGISLSDYVQHAALDVHLSRVGWHVFADTISAKGKMLIEVKPSSDRLMRETAGRANNRALSDIVVPKNSPDFQHMSARIVPFGASDSVLRVLVLRCGGGEGTTNCVRNPARFGWCAGQGRCDETCSWHSSPDSAKKRKNKILHLCNAELVITWTIKSVSEGSCFLKLRGEHCDPNEEWVPTALNELKLTDKTAAVVNHGSFKLATTAQTQSHLQGSPSAIGDPRRDPTKKVISAAQRALRYSATIVNQRVGDFSTVDGLIRDRILQNNLQRAASDSRPFIVHYHSSKDTFHIAVTTRFNLAGTFEHGQSMMQSDDKVRGYARLAHF